MSAHTLFWHALVIGGLVLPVISSSSPLGGSEAMIPSCCDRFFKTSFVFSPFGRRFFVAMSAGQVETSATPTAPITNPTAADLSVDIALSPQPSPLKRPSALSPSSLGDFKTCPRMFRFRYMEKVPEPPSEVMVRGNMIHNALEKVKMIFTRQDRVVVVYV